MSVIAIRGEIVDFLSDPMLIGDAAMRHWEDGVLLITDGKVTAIGDANELLTTLDSDVTHYDYSGKIIFPGFVDTHVHYPQCEVIASYGTQLLDWLNNYTFPAENKFADKQHAGSIARFFRQQLLANGTTSAMVFATVHPQSVDAMCEEAGNMRLLVGKVMMDRHAPDYLCDTPETSYQECTSLIARWHGQDRLGYALTPRFAPTSTEAQLEVVQTLLGEYPDIHLQTHVAENQDEVAWVAKIFPWSRSYLDVYDRYSMLHKKAVYAHCIWLDERDRERLGESGAAIAFCPTSNLFLGSGLFDLEAAYTHKIRVGLGSDVGGGTSFSLLRTLAEGYKVLQLNQQSLHVRQGLYLATLGGARALYLDQHIGNFEIGKEADLTVLDPACTPLIQYRMEQAGTLDERLFALMMLGDDRAIYATHLLGKPAWIRAASTHDG